MVKTCDNHSFMLKELLHTRLGNDKRLSPQLNVHGLLSKLVVSQRKVLSSFSFKFHSFTHRIGAYRKCNQDERGGIRIFYSYLHLLSRGTRASWLARLVANQIIPECKMYAPALMFMSRTSKTLITDRGPPTFGDGISPNK